MPSAVPEAIRGLQREKRSIPVPEDEHLSNTTDDRDSVDDVGEEKRSILKLICNAQELDPQCRRTASQLRGRTTVMPALQLNSHRYSENEEKLLLCDDHVSVLCRVSTGD